MIRKTLGIAAVALSLSACGNDTQTQQAGQIFKGIFSSLTGAGKGPERAPVPSQQEVAAALGNTSEPLALLTIENRKAWAFLVEIERNGNYHTYGTSDRQTVTLNKGLVTATRGLSADLMSVDADRSIALVSARKPGQTTRRVRVLDGEDQTFAYEFNCTVTRGKTQKVPLGGKQVTARSMTERCVASTRDFQNTYLVDPSGWVLASRQWIGPLNGYVTVSQMRK